MYSPGIHNHKTSHWNIVVNKSDPCALSTQPLTLHIPTCSNLTLKTQSVVQSILLRLGPNTSFTMKIPFESLLGSQFGTHKEVYFHDYIHTFEKQRLTDRLGTCSSHQKKKELLFCFTLFANELNDKVALAQCDEALANHVSQEIEEWFYGKTINPDQGFFGEAFYSSATLLQMLQFAQKYSLSCFGNALFAEFLICLLEFSKQNPKTQVKGSIPDSLKQPDLTSEINLFVLDPAICQVLQFGSLLHTIEDSTAHYFSVGSFLSPFFTCIKEVQLESISPAMIQIPCSTEVLDLTGNSEVTDAHLQSLSTLCPNLIKLSISSTSLSLEACSLPTTLRQLDLADSDVSDATLRPILENLNNLQMLELRGLNITCRGVSFPNSLAHLSLADCKMLSSADTAGALKNCTQLSTLDVDSSNINLGLLPPLPSLLALHANRLPHLGDVGLRCALAHAPNILQLSIAESSVTLCSTYFPEGLPQSLRILNLTACPIMDMHFFPAIKSCSKLQQLDISFTNLWLRDGTLPSSLIKLAARKCPNINSINLAIASAACPNLKFFGDFV